ncbi:hypothetical protein PhCBS80983_g05822 [Powellomyces hirtus]|uniref:Uncharacterized protein n=1 Tax=Powellomyces hirtus TaxID=109895 RepID=A0A507DSJ3_9FUNG|nr:hypothetical protein PhCBS80983_g05822 [Powellomyces hirtus]
MQNHVFQTLLEEALNALGQLSFAQCQRIANKMEDSSFRKILNQLVSAEMVYEGLGFVRQRFFRKENLGLALKTLQGDVKDWRGRVDLAEDGPMAGVRSVLEALEVYCLVRERLVHVHTTLASAERHVESTYVALFEEMGNIEGMYIAADGDAGLNLLLPLKNLGYLVECEVSCLRSLFQAEVACEEYKFKDAAFQLFLANDQIMKLQSLVINNSHTLAAGAATGGVASCSELHQFYAKLIASLTDKTGLFFYRVLSSKQIDLTCDNSASAPLRLLWQYQSQTKARSVSLIYLIRPEQPFCVDGYACSHGGLTDQLTGLQSFPSVCNVPADPPIEHWPNIVSILQRELLPHLDSHKTSSPWSQLPSSTPPTSTPSTSTSATTSSYSSLLSYLRPHASPSPTTPSTPKAPRPKSYIHFYDPKVNATYLLAHVVPRLVLSIVHQGRYEDRKQAGMAFGARIGKCLEHEDALTFLRVKS